MSSNAFRIDHAHGRSFDGASWCGTEGVGERSSDKLVFGGLPAGFLQGVARPGPLAEAEISSSLLVVAAALASADVTASLGRTWEEFLVDDVADPRILLLLKTLELLPHTLFRFLLRLPAFYLITFIYLIPARRVLRGVVLLLAFHWKLLLNQTFPVFGGLRLQVRGVDLDSSELRRVIDLGEKVVHPFSWH